MNTLLLIAFLGLGHCYDPPGPLEISWANVEVDPEGKENTLLFTLAVSRMLDFSYNSTYREQNDWFTWSIDLDNDPDCFWRRDAEWQILSEKIYMIGERLVLLPSGAEIPFEIYGDWYFEFFVSMSELDVIGPFTWSLGAFHLGNETDRVTGSFVPEPSTILFGIVSLMFFRKKSQIF